MATVGWQQFRSTNAKATGNTITFQSQLPCCSVTILETSVSGYKLRLPARFSTNIYVKKGKLILQGCGGKRWDTSYFEENSRICLSGGWMNFARDNDLKVGDVCGFELLPGMIVVTLQVSIFRASDGVPLGYEESTHQSGQHSFRRPSSSTFQRPASAITNDLGEFTPKRPHFFKIILENSEAMLEYKLLIPRRFVRIYGHNIATYVQVKDPSGRKWTMQLSKSDGDTWFKNGWKEFANYYSIGHGHVLVFEYEGNSQFNVVIIDKSATEIMYPVARAHDVEENRRNFQEIEMEETDEDTETDDFTPSLRKGKKSPAKGFSVEEKCKQNGFYVRTEKLKGDEKAEAFEKATAFNSKNPFFSMIMQPSYIGPISARLRIPSSFYIDFINKNEGDASLHSNGRRWNVKYLNVGSKGKDRKLRATKEKEKTVKSMFGVGWKTFAEENYLEVGDVCIFELIDITNVAFQVHIYRVNENIDPSPSSRKRKQDTHGKAVIKKPKTRDVQLKEHKTNEYADRFSSGNPFFRVFMEPRFLSSPYLDIPMDFVEKHFEQKNTEVLLLVGKRTWTLQFCQPGRFCGGWYKFVQDNSLQKRDVCIFELIDKSNLVMRVHIFGGLLK